jgi:hypothetical protein
MKDKQETEDLTTDDELTREAGMTAGNVVKGRFKMRPMTALSLSWLQRNRVFDDGGDMMQKTAAYAFLHTEPKDEIRAVVNNPAAFADAVDEWIERNINHHTELEPVSEEMSDAVEHYMAATTTAANPSPGKPGAAKN